MNWSASRSYSNLRRNTTWPRQGWQHQTISNLNHKGRSGKATRTDHLSVEVLPRPRRNSQTHPTAHSKGGPIVMGCHSRRQPDETEDSGDTSTNTKAIRHKCANNTRCRRFQFWLRNSPSIGRTPNRVYTGEICPDREGDVSSTIRTRTIPPVYLRTKYHNQDRSQAATGHSQKTTGWTLTSSTAHATPQRKW